MHRLIRPLLLVASISSIILVSVARASIPEAGLRLTANLSERTLTVRQGEEIVKVYDIAIGTGKHPTPTGSYAIRRLVWNPRWVPPDRRGPEGRGRRDRVIPTIR